MITEEDLSIDELVRKMKKPEIGVIVSYLGMVRDEDSEIKGMEIRISEGEAGEELENLKRKALDKFDIEAVEIVHREGSLKVGDNITLILVGAKHRKEAFRACEYLIDVLKMTKAIRRRELRQK
ncbi:MAG: molybdenum cofactor biosynthesis protein MoaE [Methanophagales archaeon]|nr:molybdenum cofactor biosynthesis protein MoaE [Methanophagales archaeon]